MKIITEGILPNKTITFNCSYCHCCFQADETEYWIKRTENSTNTVYHYCSTCPTCKHAVREDDPGLREVDELPKSEERLAQEQLDAIVTLRHIAKKSKDWEWDDYYLDEFADIDDELLEKVTVLLNDIRFKPMLLPSGYGEICFIYKLHGGPEEMLLTISDTELIDVTYFLEGGEIKTSIPCAVADIDCAVESFLKETTN